MVIKVQDESVYLRTIYSCFHLQYLISLCDGLDHIVARGALNVKTRHLNISTLSVRNHNRHFFYYFLPFYRQNE